MLPFDDQRVLCLEIPLQGKENVHINFAEEVEKIYGPSINSNRRKRRYADEYYDRHDPFIDDTELYIEEMAAASKDGFFVFSGPLVAEGDKVKVERSRKTKRKKKLSSTPSNAANPTPATPQPSMNDQPVTNGKPADKTEEDSNDDEQPLQTISMHERASRQSFISGSKKDASSNKSVTNKETKKETQKSLKEQKPLTKEPKSKSKEKVSRRTSTGSKSTKKSEKEEAKGSPSNNTPAISPNSHAHQAPTVTMTDTEAISDTNQNDNSVENPPATEQAVAETPSTI
ncbi:histone promoter control protein Hpc2 [Schizosaccharomyces cryophilus OY26]|uniref:Histone promoter control protein Hpc2 n=1 Tax=Schizosaccharomyces cryophilus (strain OY26 / ATCC MYA-4695 / CBS 11777 / NBRC 106824 / NRRL Y48691) TaxID=653667 RepID=S9WXM6_SCHCR|nr:histone promoter control protein Hpc2 [Schizosaccharomyces cryophilus OY26]EPY49442.1 histone promoter control protein Hpc2 [Schizosaccharomyces cryophilus OY26]